MSEGLRSPISVIKAERIKPQGVGEIYQLEPQRIFRSWGEVITGKKGEGGVVYRANRAIVDPDYTNERENEVKDLFDAQKVEPGELKRRKDLQGAFKTLYEIDAAIEAEAQLVIAKKETELRLKDPSASLSEQQKEDIYLQTAFEYGNKPGGIDDSGIYAPIMAELNSIADPENQNPPEDALEAKRLIQELNYNSEDNVFMVKTTERVFAEGEVANVEASWKVVAHVIGTELATKLQEGKSELTPEELKLIRENPNTDLTTLISLLYIHEKMDLLPPNKKNAGMLLNRQLGIMQEKATGIDELFMSNIINNLSDYEPIYNNIETEMRGGIQNFIAELGIDPKTISTGHIYRDLMLAAIVEGNDKGTVTVNNQYSLASEFNRVVDNWMRDPNSSSSERALVLRLALENKASLLLNNLLGIDKKKMESITSQNLSNFAIEELTTTERNLIPEEQEFAARQYLDANFEGIAVRMKGNKAALLRFLLMGAAIVMPGVGEALHFGAYTTEKEQMELRR